MITPKRSFRACLVTRGVSRGSQRPSASEPRRTPRELPCLYRPTRASCALYLGLRIIRERDISSSVIAETVE